MNWILYWQRWLVAISQSNLLETFICFISSILFYHNCSFDMYFVIRLLEKKLVFRFPRSVTLGSVPQEPSVEKTKDWKRWHYSHFNKSTTSRVRHVRQGPDLYGNIIFVYYFSELYIRYIRIHKNQYKRKIFGILRFWTLILRQKQFRLGKNSVSWTGKSMFDGT